VVALDRDDQGVAGGDVLHALAGLAFSNQLVLVSAVVSWCCCVSWWDSMWLAAHVPAVAGARGGAGGAGDGNALGVKRSGNPVFNSCSSNDSVM
jgi:hypothetical protein